VHAAGVLHRDVKPSNVLMEGRAPILIDFGLARVADDPKLTHTGWLLGTPGYLAPEILHGQDATAASDIHSWAATVAYAGTGHPPFGRGPSMAVMDRVRRGQHRLSGLDVRVRELVALALDPEPRRRPTLDEIRAQLAIVVPPAEAERHWSELTEPLTEPLPVAQAATLAAALVEPAPTVVRSRPPELREPVDLGWFEDDPEVETPLYTELVDEDPPDSWSGERWDDEASRSRPPYPLLRWGCGPGGAC